VNAAATPHELTLPVAGRTAALMPSEETTWLREFETRRCRKLRVLLIGNIANNAYLTAKFLRRVGVDADVLCYDYYHMMATPEWEELDLHNDWHDDYRPRFSPEDTGDFQRPHWFAQGPLNTCVAYLIANNRGDLRKAACFRELMEKTRISGSFSTDGILASMSTVENSQRQHSVGSFVRRNTSRALGLPYFLARVGGRAILRILTRLGFSTTAKVLVEWVAKKRLIQNAIDLMIVIRAKVDPPPYLDRLEALTSDFSRLFPSRQDKLRLAELLRFAPFIDVLEPLSKDYDIVQGYGTDPILPLVCGKQPYVAFEHGTLRDFIRGDNFIHRLTALAYRKAAHVFITNGDCLEHAQWLGIVKLSAMLHPVDIEQHEARNDAAIEALRKHYDADILLFCPGRHDAAKGTNVHVRALPEILKRLPGRRVALLLAPWGLQIGDSRELIRKLKCEKEVIWLKRPLCRLNLIRHLHAADVVLDQMALPNFGATAPQALAAGTPVVMSYRPKSTEWIVTEPAPILPAFTAGEVADAVITALDPTWRESFKARARSWVHTQHHHDRVVRDHLTTYRRILECQNA
jgi:glycosyltransferase involved in cell wall biosynthesis